MRKQDILERKFGRYEIKGEVGRGGMATVFHAYDPRFERNVAIKVLPQELLFDPQFRTRFDREAKMVALLEHPAIVPVYDFGDEDGQPYIVMRYMSGGSLTDRFENGNLSLDEINQIITRIAQALDAAHAKGIIHRDLKPGNILFDQYGNAFLTDFGIARLKQSANVSTLTGSAILGTPAYMSPEQVQGDREIDSRSDIYSMGVILYQMLTGKTPYIADTPAKIMMMHLLEPVPNIIQSNAELPRGFSFVIGSALAKEPDDRYQTAGDLAEAVESAVLGGSMVTKVLPGTVLEIDSDNPEKFETPIPAPVLIDHSKDYELDSQQNVKPFSSINPTFWLWVVAGTVVLILVAFVSAGSTAIYLKLRSTPIESSGVSQVYNTAEIQFTPKSSPVKSPVVAKVAVVNTPTPNQTQEPTASKTPVEILAPTLTSAEQVVYSAPIIAGADKIAFLNDNDIWISNLDGSELKQLTNDGAEKIKLHWTPEGDALYFISGKCIQIVFIENSIKDDLACFEYVASVDSFEISPDGSQAAISINNELYIIQYDRSKLSRAKYSQGIIEMAACKHMAPYSTSSGSPYSVNEVHWSRDMQSLAIVVRGVQEENQVDLVRIIDISQCKKNPRRLDEFPATRFVISGYHKNPRITNFSWDGLFLFAMTSFFRNDGYGDLYIYNTDRLVIQAKINPINNTCCYRDPQWSPDGTYLLFAFQDINSVDESSTQLYYVPYGTMGTGLRYTPIPLPETFFQNPRGSIQAVLRPESTGK